jgi:hypothetical protein
MGVLTRAKFALSITAALSLVLCLVGPAQADTASPGATPSFADLGPLHLIFIIAPRQALVGDQILYEVDAIDSSTDPLAEVGLYFSPDTCQPASSTVSGDANGNGLLDPGEIWRYQCLVEFGPDQVGAQDLTAQASALDDGGQMAQAFASAQTTVSAPATSANSGGDNLPLLVAYVLLGVLAVMLVWLMRRKPQASL